MESNRQGHLSLYLLGMLCMFLGVACLAIPLYMIPFLVFKLQYDIPEFIAFISVWYETQYDIHGTILPLLIFLPMVLAGVAFFIIAHFIDNYLETHHEPGMPDISKEELKAHEIYTSYETTTPAELGTTATPESAQKPFHPIALVIGLIALVIFLLALGQYIVYFHVFF